MWVSSVLLTLCVVASASPAVTVTESPPGNVSEPTTTVQGHAGLFKGSGPKVQYPIRVCTSNLQEVNNCKTLSSAYKNQSSLEVVCVSKESFDECYDAFTESLVDVVSLNSSLLSTAYLKFIENAFKEVSETKLKDIPVLVAKKSFQKIGDIKPSRFCISKEQDIPRWQRTIFLFFPKYMSQHNGGEVLRNSSGYFTGGVQFSDNPIGCLESGTADVAVLGYDYAKSKIGNAVDYDLLCIPRGRRSFSEFTVCNLYGLNITGEHLEPKELNPFYNHILTWYWYYYRAEYVELAEYYEGDFTVFFSKAASSQEFIDQEFIADNSVAQQQLEEFKKTNPYFVQSGGSLPPERVWLIQ